MKLARGMLVVAAGLAVLVPGCSCDVGPDLNLGFDGGESGCRDSEVELIVASSTGDLAEVQRELDSGTSPDVVDDAGNRPLTCAGPAGQTEVVAALLDAGADVDVRSRDGDTVVTDAVRFCRPGVLALLLEAGADPNVEVNGNSALSQAVHAGGVKSVEALIAADVDVSSLARVLRTELGDRESTSECPGPTAEGRSAALLAVLEAGADPTTVLGMSASWNLIDPLRAALAAGARPDEGSVLLGLESLGCYQSVEPEEEGGTTTVVDISSDPDDAYGTCPPIAVLLQVAVPGAPTLDPDVFTTTTTGPNGELDEDGEPTPLASPPLLEVAWWGNAEAVAALLEAGAKVDAEGASGVTALHAAAAQGHTEVVTQLLAAGAKGGISTVPPKPSALAAKQGHSVLADTLEAAGA